MKDCTVKIVRMHFLKHKTTYLILNSLNSILQWDLWLLRMWLTMFPEIQLLVHRIRSGWTKKYSLKTITSYQSPYSRKKPTLLQNKAECLRGSVLKIKFQFEYFDFWATWLHPDFVVQTSRLCRPEIRGRAFSAGVLPGPVVHTDDTFRSPVFYAASPHAIAWNRISWFNQAKLSQWWASSLSLSFQCANSGSWQPRRSLALTRQWAGAWAWPVPRHESSAPLPRQLEVLHGLDHWHDSRQVLGPSRPSAKCVWDLICVFFGTCRFCV